MSVNPGPPTPEPPASLPYRGGAVSFLLNDALVSTDEAGGLTLLDFVRRRRGLTGTKEGCKEGDCGACTVLLGELADGDEVDYRPVTSCLVPIAELHGRHVVTIEGLDLGRPSAVQRAIVEAGASQCGFCTPGIVVSLTALRLRSDSDLGPAGVEHALSGHLCRCTGYRSLRAAGAAAGRALGEATGVATLVERGELPAASFRDVAARLRALPSPPPQRSRPGPVIAGGSDLFVQRGEELAETAVSALNLRPELRGVRLEADDLRGSEIVIGALTTFEDLAVDPLLAQRIPRIREFMGIIASWQVRNRATVGGNLINASPIGDVTILLLALGATAVLERAGERRPERREVPLATFYRGYKQLDLQPGEILIEARLPDLGAGERVHFEKVSKRRHLDIATVNSAIRLAVDGDRITAAALAAGGVAPIPLLLERTSRSLVGRPLDAATVREALATAQDEIAPISDVRGSADYKRLLVRQLLVAHFATLFPQAVKVEDFYAA